MIERTRADERNVPLALERLVKRYPGAPVNAVDGVTLALSPGEIFGLLGPNGAGKTTTVAIASTRARATSGAVTLAGIDVARQPSAARRRVGVVTQINTLDRSLSVWENLYYHCRYFGFSRREARQRSDELLVQFELRTRRGERIDRLSGGLAQRVQLARALAHRPPVLFLDEPTAGLDPQSRLALWDAVRSLGERESVTVLLTTHYMEEADQLCDRVAIIDHGRILVCDEPRALKQRTADRTAVELKFGVSVEPDLLDRLRGLAGVDGVTAEQDTVKVLVRERDGLLPSLVSATAGSLRDLSVTEPTLESVFIELTGRSLRD